VSELPAGWARARLDELAEVKLGRQRSPKNHSGERMRPYLRAANVTWSGLDLSDVKEMNFTEGESRTFELRPGDILVGEASGSRSEVGKPAIWRGEIPNCCFQNTLLRVRSYGPLPEYLHHLLRADALTGRFGDSARGVGIHHIGAARMSSWSVPIAPLAEQRRIVAAIDEQISRLDAAEFSLKHGHQRLALLRAAVYLEAFDGEWPLSTLGEINDPDRPICYGILMPKEHCENGVLYVKVKDYPKGKVLLGQLHRTTPEIAAKYRRSSLRPDDILVSIRGTTGRIAVAPPELDGANITQDTARVAPQPHVGVGYLVAYLRSSQAQRYFRQVARGVAVKGLNIGDLRTMPIPVPPLPAQAKIVTELERRLSIIEAIEGQIDRALRARAVLHRSILARAFAGQLIPQVPTDEPAVALLERLAAERAAVVKPSRRRRTVPA
jgi:type I restriction enzyme S subunit